MSLTSPVPDAEGIVFTSIGETCFLCDRPTTDPSFHWMGATGHVFFHPSCAATFAEKIVEDLRRLC